MLLLLLLLLLNIIIQSKYNKSKTQLNPKH